MNLATRTLRISITLVTIGAGLGSARAGGATEPEQVTFFGSWASNSTVSPDGAWLAFESSDGIFRMVFPAGTPELIVPGGGEPAWGPGNRIAYMRGDTLRVYDVGTTSDVALADGLEDGPDWSPTGNEIVVQANGIVAVSYPGGSSTTVSCADPIDGDCEGEWPSWSADGNWIAFEDGLEIMKVERAGGAAVAVVQGLRDVSYPEWSPDGAWIAFTMDDETGQYINLWIVPADGSSAPVQVTSGSYYDTRPTWSPDSAYLYFDSNRGGSDQIWKVGVEAVPVESVRWGGLKARFGSH